MLKYQANSLIQQIAAHIIRWYCSNTPICKGKYKLQLFAMNKINIPKKVPFTYFGIKYDIDTKSVVGSRLFYFNEYEKKDIERCLTYLNKKESIFFDVGTNFGIYSLTAAKHGAKVYSFEPHPQAFEELQNNIQLNQGLDIQTFKIACAEEDGEVRFTCAIDSAYSSLHETAYDWEDWQVKKGEQLAVSAKKIDTIVEELNIDFIDYCKIDVEGGEFSVLRGAKKMLLEKRILALQVEISQTTYKGAGYNALDLINFLKEYGYISTETLLEEIVTEPNFISMNCLFVPTNPVVKESEVKLACS